MPTLPQQEKTNESDLGTISFQVPELWKRQVLSQAALRGESMREICTRAVAKYLKLELPDEMRA